MKRKRVSLKIRRSKVRKWRGGRGLVYGSLALIGLVILALLFPVVDGSSSALGEDITMTAGLTTKTTAYLYSTLSLSTSGQVDIDIVPKSRGALSIGAADVQVATNNTTGYSIFLSTVDQTNRLNQIDSDLQYSGSEQQNYIAALGTTTTAGDYLATSSNLNTWGYALTTGEATSNTEYRGISSSSGDQIYTTTGTTSHDNYKLNVAVAVDTSLPAGGYRNGLVVTAVANPIILSGFNQIYYMQDMTPSICESAEMESTAQLVDKRDNKLYWVAKLKDGNCWMTQNLALDLSTDKALTPEDSDVRAEWVPEASTVFPATDIVSNNTQSWNLGKIILTSPTSSTACSNIAFGDSLTGCQWYEDITGLKAGYSATETSSISPDRQSYDEHYLVGNHYSYGAATAGTGIGISSPASAATKPDALIDATGSICPKGWKLPTSGRNTNTAAGWPFDREDSFYRLLHAYGYPKTGNSDTGNASVIGWSAGDGNGFTAIVGDGITRIDYRPIYFVRSGYIDVRDRFLKGVGAGGYYRASTAAIDNSSSAYYLSFDFWNITPSGNPPNNFGYPVRCLAY